MTETFIGTLANAVERVKPLNNQYNLLKCKSLGMKPEQLIRAVEEMVGIRRYEIRMIKGVLR